MTVRIGILGTGFMGTTHATALAQVPGASLAGFSARDEQKGRAVAEKYGTKWFESAEALINSPDVDAVDISLPSNLHEKYAVMAAEAGKHLLIEKPLALSLSSADRIAAAIDKAGVVGMAAHVLRFFPQYIAIREAVQSGRLGRILAVEAYRLLPGSLKKGADPLKWRQKAEGGGALWDLLVHDLDFVLSLTGEVAAVNATGLRGAGGAWDHVVASLRYADGSIGTVQGSLGMPKGFPFTFGLRVLGEEGGAELFVRMAGNLENRENATTWVNVYAGGQSEEISPDGPDPFVAELSHFVEAVQAGRQPVQGSIADARRAVAVLSLAEKSLETGEAVKA